MLLKLLLTLTEDGKKYPLGSESTVLVCKVKQRRYESWRSSWYKTSIWIWQSISENTTYVKVLEQRGRTGGLWTTMWLGEACQFAPPLLRVTWFPTISDFRRSFISIELFNMYLTSSVQGNMFIVGRSFKVYVISLEKICHPWSYWATIRNITLCVIRYGIN